MGFYQPHLDIRGTGVAYFDYAFYNQKILGNVSIMIYDENHPVNHPLVKEKFEQNMILIPLRGSQDMFELYEVCVENNVDAIYIHKYGRKNDGRFIHDIPTLIHACGPCYDPHGTIYSYTSQWLSNEFSGGNIPVIPLMINLPDHNDNFRQELGIPEDSIVIGRTGGLETFDIEFVYPVIEQISQERKNVYFLFANTNSFSNNNPRIIFMDGFADIFIKRKFINTCDAMIHARTVGESFGVAIGEFSWCNKPIITYANSIEKNHIFMLQDKGLYYSDSDSLYDILKNFVPQPEKDWNCYKNCSPENVMIKFKEVFLDKI